MYRLRQEVLPLFLRTSSASTYQRKVKVYRFSFCFQFIRQVLTFLSCFYVRFIVFGYMAPPRILILGHSFIRRLAGFLQKREHQHLMAKLSSLGSVNFHGVGGRTIGKVRKFGLGIIRRLNPDIIVLELDTNDLTKLPARAVGSELENLVRYLHDEFNVKSIAVCQVIRRHSPECTKYNFSVTKLHLYH